MPRSLSRRRRRRGSPARGGPRPGRGSSFAARRTAAVETIEFWPIQHEPEDRSGLNANSNPVRHGHGGGGGGGAGGGGGGGGGANGGRKRPTGGNLLAVGDALGTAHILRLPRPLTRPSIAERNGTQNFIDWEAARVEYMGERRKVRAAELQAHERESALRMDREDGEVRVGRMVFFFFFCLYL
jgi:hypothetical protein